MIFICRRIKLKKIISVIFILSVLSVSAFSQVVTEDRMSVVVLPGTEAGGGDRMSRILNLTVEEMNRLGRFEIIDRRTTEQKMEELKLRLSGMIDDDSVIEIGNMLSSDIGMIVDITAYQVSKSEERVEVETEGLVSVKYETIYDAIIDITIRQFDINTSKAMKTISVTGEGNANSYTSAEEEAYRDVKGGLSDVLKEFYPLILKVTEVRGNFVIVSGGENIGVEKGMKFDVLSSMDDFDRAGLILIEKTGPDSASARILKGFGLIDEGYYLEERINKFPETAISAAVSRNYEDDFYALDFACEFNTYNPFSVGFDLLFSTADTDFFRTDIFGTYKPFLSDFFDFGIRGGVGLTYLYGVRDEEDHKVSSLKFQILTGAIATFYLNEKIALFGAGDYLFYPGKSMNWFYYTGTGEDMTKHDAVGDTPTIDLDGFYLTVGMKIIP
jgi:hypothetical protein